MTRADWDAKVEKIAADSVLSRPQAEDAVTALYGPRPPVDWPTSLYVSHNPGNPSNPRGNEATVVQAEAGSNGDVLVQNPRDGSSVRVPLALLGALREWLTSVEAVAIERAVE